MRSEDTHTLLFFPFPLAARRSVVRRPYLSFSAAFGSAFQRYVTDIYFFRRRSVGESRRLAPKINAIENSRLLKRENKLSQLSVRFYMHIYIDACCSD